MKTYIEQLAQLLVANEAPYTHKENIQWLEKKSREIENLYLNKECNTNLVNSVFGYILNHHTFEINDFEKLNTIIDALVELVCPLAQDDERSKCFIQLIQGNIDKRNKF